MFVFHTRSLSLDYILLTCVIILVALITPCMILSDEKLDLYTDTDFENKIVPQVATPNNLHGDRSSGMPNGRLRVNSVHPSSVTLHNAKVEGNVKEFMEGYQKSLSPASLPLYFYIAYQFIQEMSDEGDKTQVQLNYK